LVFLPNGDQTMIKKQLKIAMYGIRTKQLTNTDSTKIIGFATSTMIVKAHTYSPLSRENTM